MTLEYNYNLITEELLSVSIHGDDEIIFSKYDSIGEFLEEYEIIDSSHFKSISKEGKINNTYQRIVGSFDYECNIKYIRDDERVYFSQNPVVNIDAFPFSDKIKKLVQSEYKIRELIYTIKLNIPNIYIIYEII